MLVLYKAVCLFYYDVIVIVIITDDSEPAISSTQHFDSGSDEGAPESSDVVDLYEPEPLSDLLAAKGDVVAALGDEEGEGVPVAVLVVVAVVVVAAAVPVLAVVVVVVVAGEILTKD